MIQKIKTSKFSKVVAIYLSAQLLITSFQQTALYALTSGPSQPEFNSFTPIGTSDMVDLTSGNFNYNIPIMDVGGYPLNLAYDSGITMDQEASWVGLGWNLNVGQINRQVRGIPDDFKGDKIIYENNMRDNVTVGLNAGIDLQVFGLEQSDNVKGKKKTSLDVGFGVDLRYNNYTGLSFKPSYGLAFGLSENLSVDMDIETSATDGVTISPSVNAKSNLGKLLNSAVSGGLNAGVSYNSNQGLQKFTFGAKINAVNDKMRRYTTRTDKTPSASLGTSGAISFLNNTMTPRKRTAFRDISGTLAVSFGVDLWGVDPEVEISATGAVQQIKDKIKEEKSFGYEFTGFASVNNVLDYNREDEQAISKTTLALPTTNYTYDLYSVQGQGASGMFRPFRSQIGQINDQQVQDQSESFSLGLEIEPGSGFHSGLNFTDAPSKSYTGIWDTRALKHFKQTREDQREYGENLDYEPVYFKYIGQSKVDKDEDLFEDLGGYDPVALKIGGNKRGYNKYADTRFRRKVYTQDGTPSYIDLPTFSSKFKRKYRDLRNQNIQKFTKKEVEDLYDVSYYQNKINDAAKAHHTAEMRVQQPDGSTYVFGETAYNTVKKEVTFTTDSNNFNCATGIVYYNQDPSKPDENTTANKSGIDHFFNAVHTPAYAHTYMLSAVLSSDYEDLTGNGPTDDDLGAYTKFTYTTFDDYKWRVPYGKDEASYNAGLNTNPSDQKGSYVYGQKELKYVQKIETKTHIAIFDISKRKDGKGVDEENGGGSASSGSMYKIDQIRLYSKPEYKRFEDELEDNDPDNDPSPSEVSPIKTAHFIYDYSQCKGIANNLGGNLNENELTNDGGKLTLKEVYFTYRNSNMGKYTPYQFNYDGENPDYNLKSYDVWGNYKPNTEGGCNTADPITVPEFPFVDQNNRENQDRYAAAWTLTSINLPSGGKIDLEFESDDYQYVQDRKAAQMFKVVGAGQNNRTGDPEGNTKLYKFSKDGETVEDARYLYIKLEDGTDNTKDFVTKYFSDKMGDKPIYFRFLMNMLKSGAISDTDRNYDYVTGYFERGGDVNVFKADNQAYYAAIPMKFRDMEGGFSAGKDVNPISKAGWYFGRQNLNGWVYGLNMDARSENVASIAQKIVSSFSAISEIFSGPNGKLRRNAYLCAQRFIPEKSWIRLSAPKSKVGGGIRVKELKMYDQWSKMLDRPDLEDSERYNKEYGQTYEYTLEDGTSSGVATYEPAGSKENPFVEPYYNDGDRLVAPKEVSYVEKPFGESFFPSASVTYSKVTISNLKRDGITKHATGKIVTENFTSKDYPTKVDFTLIDDPENYVSNEGDVLGNLLGSFFGSINVKNEFALSQGFVVHTNDMNGKTRMQTVYAEGTDKPISSVEYKYSTSENDITRLDNKLPVIFKDGTVADKQLSVDYDVVTDFRKSYSNSRTTGYKANLVVLMIGIFPIPIPSSFISSTSIENVAYTTMTTKVVHTTAIMKEKIAMDLGSRVSTSNEAWDAETGQILLTKTVNEYNDQYYNFNFPAYWSYKNIGQASKNIGLEGVFTKAGDYYTISEVEKYITLGDEILASYENGIKEKLWVVGFNSANSGVLLMDDKGLVLNKSSKNIDGNIRFKVVRSGYRNMQNSMMGAITMMKNPIPSKDASGNYIGKLDTSSFSYDSNTGINPRIINASAISYDEFWNCPCENGLESIPYATPDSDQLADLNIEEYGFNPYLYNVKGDWRADKSYTYLTERTHLNTSASSETNTRKEGYFKNFTPFYILTNDGWVANEESTDKWTFTSEITQYISFGPEIENRDALDRYSSAQYGYNMTLPIAVTSNSKYRYMGADNFEDYSFLNTEDAHYSFKDQVTGDGDGGIEISDNHAHTGVNSLLVPTNNQAEMTTRLQGTEVPDDDYDNDGWKNDEDKCPYTYSSNLDRDGDGIGDECDTNHTPEIIKESIKITRQFRGWRKQATFTIQGTPNTEVVCKITVNDDGHAGGWVYVNGWLDEGRWFDRSKMEFTVPLDPTGRAYIQYEVKAHRSTRNTGFIRYKTIPNRIDLDFRIIGAIHASGIQTPVYNSEVIKLNPTAYRNPNSGGGGDASLFSN